MRSLAFALCAGLMVGSLWAAAPADTASTQAITVAASESLARVAAVEGITEYRLANGLRVLLAPDESKPTTTVNITYLVGSRYEHYGETGMAHLLEHLMFKGSKGFPGNTIDAEFKRRGMQMNGTTWFDRTNYYETFSASDDNLDWALRMEADRMVNSFIAKEDLDSEMTVVRNEMESGENDPSQILWEKMAAAAYQWHSYGKSTIGARSDVEGVRIENLQAFYRRYYQPDNAVLTIAGKFDAARTLQTVVDTFGRIARPQRALVPTWTREPAQDGAREVTLSRVGDIQMIGALYHVPAGAHPDTAALSVLSFILGDAPSGRLHKALVEGHKAASVSAWNFELAEPGYMTFFAQLTKQQSRDEARKVLLDVVEGLARKPVTAAEVERARTALLNGFEKTMNDPEHFGVALSEAIALGDWRLFFLGRDRIEQVSLADVQRVAQTYFKASNRTFGLFVPTDKPVRVEVPATPDLGVTLTGYVGKAAQQSGEAFDPAPDAIEARVSRSVLPNGAKLALLPKRNRGQTVNGRIVLGMGTAESLKGLETVADFTAEMLSRGSVGRSRQQIADALEGLKAQLAISAQDGNAVVIDFETRRDKLASFLGLLEGILRRPVFSANELRQLQTETIAALEAGRREPQAMATRAMGRYENPWPKGDVRYIGTLDEEIADTRAVTPAALKQFHARFYGANHARIALVGDFDAPAAAEQLSRLFGHWSSAQAFARVPHPYRERTPTEIRLNAPEKANAFLMSGASIPLRDDAEDFPAAVLATQILGGGSGLKSRLADRLRQKEGLSYGVGAMLQSSPHEANAGLVMYAIYAPQYLDRVRSAMDEEFALFVREGVSEAELQEARAGLMQERRLARTRDAGLAGLLALQLDLGRTMDFERLREAQLESVTLEQINRVIRHYFDAGRLVKVVAGDFAPPSTTAK
ncbi:pitrilysin family protein [Niveibacterium umoris]